MPNPILESLVPDFRNQAQAVLARCQGQGVEMRPNEGLRNPFRQAIYWRQSRPTSQIHQKIEELQRKGALYLAHCIAAVGKRNGPHVTNAIPGFSWHQWGEALDCYWVVDGESEWSTERKVNGVNGFHLYASQAAQLGLTAGGNWSGFKDWPHIQLRAQNDILALHTLDEIDRLMYEKFGDLPSGAW